MTEPTAEEIRKMAAWAGVPRSLIPRYFADPTLAWNDGRLMFAAMELLMLCGYRFDPTLYDPAVDVRCVWWNGERGETYSSDTLPEAVWAAWRDLKEWLKQS